jgi:hypothetical protein
MHKQGSHEEPSFRQLDDWEIQNGWEQYPLYTTPPAQPAPVQELCGWQFFQDGKWHNGMDNNDHKANTEAAGFPVRDVYPEAQPAAWVGLTAEDYPDADNPYCCVNADFIEGARWADATLRQKNGGKV